MEINNNQDKIKNAESVANAHSPFLARLIMAYPEILEDIRHRGVDYLYESIIESISELMVAPIDIVTLKKELRVAKRKIALTVALADISGIWSLEKITESLSIFAEKCLNITINHLLFEGCKQEKIYNNNFYELFKNGKNRLRDIARDSGVIVLAMGKLGAYELNYSSDIDLILFFTPEKIGYKGRNTEQHFMNRLAHDLVSVMQDRTELGYVFRTDLRLRPDPYSTPPVITIDAAYHYYESVGQNWERAAMIKARAIAGDIKAGEDFLKSLTPFMWRRNLDFAAINDIHSIKRQIDKQQIKSLDIRGHNVKLGTGGIREIEFLAQIYQLIWGGREPELRIRKTCDTLRCLTEMGLISTEQEKILNKAYQFLRMVEHRLQMVNDEQTHSVPENDNELLNIATFNGYDNIGDFERQLVTQLSNVHEIYLSSFNSEKELSSNGNLIFTGEEHNPDTLRTLTRMGYSNPELVSETIMKWHHGSSRATRTKRARELLTEIIPELLECLAKTISPDTAFMNFNYFLQKLPATIQLFSLFKLNPHLLGLIADIMGSAPTLAESLSKNPDLLEAVIYEDFYDGLPNVDILEKQLDKVLLPPKNLPSYDFEQIMGRLRKFYHEKQFQAGVQLLKGMINAKHSGEFLTYLAEIIINRIVVEVTSEFKKTYGTISGNRFAIIALGKLGSREMTFLSDVDLIFIYDVDDTEELSNGQKGFTASVYYNRLSQRIISSLTSQSRDGRLYEVDTRLRPSGNQGPLAVSKAALEQYFDQSAWTFEYMAFTKARAIAGDESLLTELNGFIDSQIKKKRDIERLKYDVADMREKIEKEHSATSVWDIKYARGGLIDVDFIAQYLMLKYASDLLTVKSGNSIEFFTILKQEGFIGKESDTLIDSYYFLKQLLNMIRLCCGNNFVSNDAPEGLKKILVDTTNSDNFEKLSKKLQEVEKNIYSYYKTIFE
ncbi:MAG: bifunctional [glutamine synthetase] adenylyltransferase/[glutamine synthetase]-adenylyl-L-tyrosine phosphorylase [Rickettsiales bacterium]